MKNNDNNNNLIRQFREDFSISRNQLASLLSVSCRTIEAWEIDRYSPSKPILKLLNYIKEKLENNKKTK